MSNNKKVDKLILIIGVMAIILSVLVLYISKNMLRAEGDLFLDGTSVEDAQKALGVRIVTVPTDGYEFIKAILDK